MENADIDTIRGFARSIANKQLRITDISGLQADKTNIILGMNPMVIALVYYYKIKYKKDTLSIKVISKNKEYLMFVFNNLTKSKDDPSESQEQDILILLYRYIKVMYKHL